jgi:hypothetical protein
LADAEFEECGVFVQVEAGFGAWDFGRLTLAFEFFDGEHVEGDRILAEPDLVQDRGVVEERACFALVLADEGVDDAENEFIREDLGHDFGDGLGEAPVIALEPEGIVDAAHGEAVEVAGDAGDVVVEEGADADDFGEFLGDQTRDVGTASGVGQIASELEVAPDEATDERRFVEGERIVTVIGAAFDENAVSIGEDAETGVVQIGEVTVPDDDVLRRETGGEQTGDDGFDHGGSGTGRALSGEDFDADEILSGDEAEPGVAAVVFAEEGWKTVIDHGGDAIRDGNESGGCVGMLADEDSGSGGGLELGVFGVERGGWGNGCEGRYEA